MLRGEINNDQSVTIACSDVTVSGDDCDIIMAVEPSAAEKTTIDGIVAAHSGASYSTLSIPVTLEPTGSLAFSCYAKGKRFVATLNDTTNCDLVISASDYVEFQGLHVWYTDASDGDYIEVKVIDDSDPENEVATKAETIYIPPGANAFGFMSEGTAQVPPGYGVRIKYVSTATSGNQPKLYAVYRYWK
jgi:hypothetical protein